MPVEPVTATLATAGTLSAWRTISDVVVPMIQSAFGNELHERSTQILPKLLSGAIQNGKLPPNHHLERASKAAIQDAVHFVISSMDDELDKSRPLVPVLVTHWKESGGPLKKYINKESEKEWVKKFRKVVKGKAKDTFATFDDSSVLVDGSVTEVFLENSESVLADIFNKAFVSWLKEKVGEEFPEVFSACLEEGFLVPDQGGERLTFFDVYSLFLRERLKFDTQVFRTSVAESLATLRKQLGDIPSKDDIQEVIDKALEALPGFDEDRLFQRIAVSFGKRFASFSRSIESQFDEVRAELARQSADLKHLLGGITVRKVPQALTPKKPTDLLVPRFRSVDLIGRERILDDLISWVDSEIDGNASVRVVIGGAGAGKTRLATEWAIRLAESHPDWKTGFVEGASLKSYDDNKNWADLELGDSPSALIIDYAAEVSQPLQRFLQELATRAERDELAQPIRILLLERHADPNRGWFQALLSEGLSQSSGDIRDLLRSQQPLELPTFGDLNARHRLFRDGLAQFAELDGLNPENLPTLPQPGEDKNFDDAILQSQWSDPLYLLMAAGAFLSSSTQQVVPILHLGRFDLATRVAEHELGRIARIAPVADGVHKAIMRQMAFLATLWGGIREDELRPSIENLLEIRGDHLPEGPGQTERKLVEALPSATSGDPEKENSALQMAPILPDIVGEAALVIEGKSLRDQQFREILKMAEGINFIQATASLIRTVQDFSPDGEESAIQWLDILRQNSESNPDQLKWIAMQLPPATIALRRFRVDVLSSQLAVDSEIGETKEARIQNSLAVYFGELGKRDEALESARRAVEIYERLAESKPDAFLPGLAMSLNNLSNCLSDVGQRDEALESARRAVEIYERLAESKPDALLTDLARSLNNLSIRLSAVGRRDEALESARRAVEIRERLVESKPDAFLPDLAISLNNLSNLLSDVGRRDEALESARRAVEIYERLAESKPDAFLPDLARSLNNLSVSLSAVGRRDEALESARRAVEIRERLAESKPDAFLPDLAISLNNLANGLSDLGQRDEALEAAGRAVEIYETRAKAKPDAFLPSLAMSLNNLAKFLGDLGHRDEALEVAGRAFEIYETMAKAKPDAFLPDLAVSLNNLAKFLSVVGQLDEALEAVRRAVEIYERLAESKPDAFLPDLAMSLNNLAGPLNGVGQLDEALEAARRAVEIRETLAESKPDAFLPDLAISLGALGSVYRGMEKKVEARDQFSRAIQILTPHFKAIPGGFAQLIQNLTRDYLKSCEALNEEPDAELLGPIVEVFEALQSEGDTQTG